MRLISWNVNGLRAAMKKGFIESMTALDSDIICLQETKMEQGQAEVDLTGYHEYWHSAEKKGYSGTAVFTREKPLSATYGMGIPEHDREGRIITLRYPAFTLVNVYTPNSKRGLLRLDYRMVWEDAFCGYVSALATEKPVIICGDLNVAHQPIDIRHPKANERNAGFTIEERTKMTALLDAGFADTFRSLHPEEVAYSWWSYMGNARANNTGWRIDYFVVSKELLPRLRGAAIHPEIHGSDHCPVEITVDV